MKNISRKNFNKALSAGLGAASINPFSGASVKVNHTVSLKKRPII